MRTPVTVTFDANTYGTVADPKFARLPEKWRQLGRDRSESKRRRIAW